MDVKILHKDNFKLQMRIGDTSPSFVNTLRRLVVSEVLTMAIEDVEISKNSSALYDEMIAHRLGLIVLKTDLSSYNVPKNDEVLTSANSCKLSLSVKGPCTVYASDLKSNDSKVVPVFPKTILVKLLEGQELELEATAMLGRGQDHAKWSAGHAWYSYDSIITANNKSKQFEEFKDKYPTQIFNDKGMIDAKLINTPQLIDACEGICEDVVSIKYIPDAFIFNLESFGQLTPVEVIKEAIKVYDEHLTEFDALIK